MNLIGWRSIDLSDISGKVGRKRSGDHANILKGMHLRTYESSTDFAD